MLFKVEPGDKVCKCRRNRFKTGGALKMVTGMTGEDRYLPRMAFFYSLLAAVTKYDPFILVAEAR